MSNIEKYRKYFTKIRKRFSGISCAFADLEGNIFTKYYGFADREESVPVDENTVFPACSISKFITVICVMKEYEQGMIDIDKPVNHYLDRWKLLTSEDDQSDVAIRSLLCHTAGTVDGEDRLRRNDTPSIIMIEAGRMRWKIENEGFNNQKNGIYRIEHLNSRDSNAMKNHYLLTQISDILMQLYLAWNPFIKKIGQSIKNDLYPIC